MTRWNRRTSRSVSLTSVAVVAALLAGCGEEAVEDGPAPQDDGSAADPGSGAISDPGGADTPSRCTTSTSRRSPSSASRSPPPGILTRRARS